MSKGDRLRTNVIMRPDLIKEISRMIEWIRIKPTERFTSAKHDLLSFFLECLTGKDLEQESQERFAHNSAMGEANQSRLRTEIFFPNDIGGRFISAALMLAQEQPEEKYRRELTETLLFLSTHWDINFREVIGDWRQGNKDTVEVSIPLLDEILPSRFLA